MEHLPQGKNNFINDSMLLLLMEETLVYKWYTKENLQKGDVFFFLYLCMLYNVTP